MNIVIFAGGVGSRLWPLSRKNAPKQFEFLKDGRSTLRMAFDRVASFGSEHIYISTNQKYIDLVKKQIPEIPEDHIFSEPTRRDLAPAVALSLFRLKEKGLNGRVALLWSDHFMDRPDVFLAALKKADEHIKNHPRQLVFLGEKPRFANHNLGWISCGEEMEKGFRVFRAWRYKPELETCKKMFQSGDWLWNPGYFVFDLDFMLELYALHMPDMHAALLEMAKDEQKLEKAYQALESISFDRAIIERIEPEEAVVIKVDLGWSDPGTLYALKEAMSGSGNENLIQGEVLEHRSSDSFIYNEEEKKIVVAVGLQGMIVVNTKDALLVCHKDAVSDMTSVLDSMTEPNKEEYL